MIAFQRRNLSPCFLIGGTIVFSILLHLILKMTSFQSNFSGFTTNAQMEFQSTPPIHVATCFMKSVTNWRTY